MKHLPQKGRNGETRRRLPPRRSDAFLPCRHVIIMSDPFVPLITAPENATGPAWWFAFQGSQLLVSASPQGAAPPMCADLHELGITPVRHQYLGRFKGRHCYACQLADDAVPPAGMALKTLRALLTEFDETLIGLAGRAFQIVEWDRTHQFCGACGTPTQLKTEERARVCPGCKLLFYPRVAPVVMVLVTRGRQLLLARKPGYAPGRYTVVAGFVEPGETLEQAIARETREEVAVEVRNIRYFGSQPWPFPHSLVIAFNAEHAAGEVKADGIEIEDARWFDLDALPELPEKIHVSRQLIDATLARLAQKSPPAE